MKLYLARHGETEWNIKGRIQGKYDSSLTDRGKHQASQLANSMKDLSIGELVTSPTSRTIETAEIVSSVLGVDFVEEEKLIEQNFGELEGHYLEDVRRNRNNNFKLLQGSSPRNSIKGGESIFQAGNRLKTYCESLVDLNVDGNYLLISHGSIIRSLVWLLLDGNSEDASLYSHFNCSYSVLTFEDGKLVVENWGSSSHLYI